MNKQDKAAKVATALCHVVDKIMQCRATMNPPGPMSPELAEALAVLPFAQELASESTGPRSKKPYTRRRRAEVARDPERVLTALREWKRATVSELHSTLEDIPETSILAALVKLQKNPARVYVRKDLSTPRRKVWGLTGA